MAVNFDKPLPIRDVKNEKVRHSNADENFRFLWERINDLQNRLGVSEGKVQTAEMLLGKRL